jgi:hypothetical protein
MQNALRRSSDRPLPLKRDRALEKNYKECIKEAREIRENQTEQEIDKTLQDSFPASDPPSWY